MKTTTSSLSVSVALCTYNGERFLLEQLDSLASQAKLPDEVVVCDDCSSDQTLSILEHWAETAPFEVRIVKNSENLGYTANFEQAARLCTRDIIFFCDQDDIWLPHKIETVVREFEKDADVHVAYSDGETIDESGNRLGIPRWACGFPWIQYCLPSYVTPRVHEMRLMAGCSGVNRRENQTRPLTSDYRWFIIFRV